MYFFVSLCNQIVDFFFLHESMINTEYIGKKVCFYLLIISK